MHRMFFLVGNFVSSLISTLCDSAVFCALHDQLASLGRHAQLTRCFSAVAELLVFSNTQLHLFRFLSCLIPILFVISLKNFRRRFGTSFSCLGLFVSVLFVPQLILCPAAKGKQSSCLYTLNLLFTSYIVSCVYFLHVVYLFFSCYPFLVCISANKGVRLTSLFIYSAAIAASLIIGNEVRSFVR